MAGSTFGRSLDKNSTAPRSIRCWAAGGYYGKRKSLENSHEHRNVLNFILPQSKHGYFGISNFLFSKTNSALLCSRVNNFHESKIKQKKQT